ncbi:hypothetical protein [Halomarina oriensis]|uniref:DUF2190 family protein n=1 Tax=Halomarina oriensis TaxID=671145 RepID=A0A6B0GSZ8_9EURY|nr:hypothetical protein [Halomarina oriensis]MWG36477.1 hypothetical protein [Halomarina oriensis]
MSFPEFAEGDDIGMTVDGGGSEGDGVAVTGDRTVSVVASADGDVDGILAYDAADQEKADVVFQGARPAKVAAGTAAGTYVDGSATAGELSAATTPVQSSILTLTGPDADGFALVLIR